MPDFSCPESRPLQVYTASQTLVHNLPYGIMGGLGAGIFLAGLGATPLGWGIGGAYLLYCLAGAVWIMVFVCPFCRFYGTRSCPCGYGWISARLRAQSPEEGFARQFRKHIPVIVPLWFIPPIAGVAFLIRDFSVPMTVLTALFAIDAFLILPWTSRKYGCANCPQKEGCPWMKC